MDAPAEPAQQQAAAAATLVRFTSIRIIIVLSSLVFRMVTRKLLLLARSLHQLLQ